MIHCSMSNQVDLVWRCFFFHLTANLHLVGYHLEEGADIDIDDGHNVNQLSSFINWDAINVTMRQGPNHKC